MGCFFSAFAASHPIICFQSTKYAAAPCRTLSHSLGEGYYYTKFWYPICIQAAIHFVPSVWVVTYFPPRQPHRWTPGSPFFLWARYAHAMMSFKKFPSLLSFFFLNRRYLTKEYPLWCLLLVVARMDSLRDTFSICCGFRAPEFWGNTTANYLVNWMLRQGPRRPLNCKPMCYNF